MEHNPFLEEPLPPTVRMPPMDRPEKKSRPRRRPEGIYQKDDISDAREVFGFAGLEVALTLEKKTRNDPVSPLNQDNILADPPTGLLGVFDGVGGSSNGAGASRTAERSVIQHYETGLRKADDLETRVLKLLLLAELNQRARDQSFRADEPREHVRERMTAAQELADTIFAIDPAMGRKAWALVDSFRMSSADVRTTKGETTACAGFIHTTSDGGRWAVVANLGDSGAIIRHADGSMEQMTEEDSIINRFLDSGSLTLEDLYAMKREPDKKFPTEFGPKSYFQLSVAIATALGAGSYVPPSLSIRKLESGEELLFCTDGVIDKFEKMVDASTDQNDFQKEQTDFEAFSRAASKGEDLAGRLDRLRATASALRAYKLVDDIAIVAARVPEVEQMEDVS